jgi:hypothetical protein
MNTATASAVSIKRAFGWKIVPTSSGTISVVHSLGQTTVIREINSNGLVRTESGSVWQLRKEDMQSGLWLLQLQQKRPVQFKKLKDRDIL